MARALYNTKTREIFTSPQGEEAGYYHFDLIVLYMRKHDLTEDQVDELMGDGLLKCGWTSDRTGTGFSDYDQKYRSGADARGIAYGGSLPQVFTNPIAPANNMEMEMV